MLKRIGLSEQVVGSILEMIKIGEFEPGSKLPSQDELASSIGVSRATLREALSKLESMGIVEIRHGEGTYIKSIDDYTVFTNVIENAILTSLVTNKDALTHLLEVRKIIEKDAVILATNRASNDELLLLLEISNNTDMHINDPEMYIEEDLEFHLKIAEYSRNPVLYKLIKIIKESFTENLLSVLEIKGILTEAVLFHKKIALAMNKRDSYLASKLMIEHLEYPNILRNKY